ncbi:endo alpha-1,4 polygalactosaminidase [Rhizobium sp. LjRoot254]|uniref:endo alpha-1,4 polygalactosaminidase n=1 Tax=Rhizobium sp. LjRoot254 TaxID=3342297 RepID=UPI003ECE9496
MSAYRKAAAAPEALNWGYQLQGRPGHPLTVETLAAKPHDMLVIDPTRDGTNATRFSEGDIAEIKGDRSILAAYVSIGEANDFRDYWDKDWTTNGKANGRLTDDAPDWLGPINPDWPEGRKVRYWDEGWRDIVFNDKGPNGEGTGELDSIVRQGFDAAYLDIVDAYYFWGAEVKKSQREPGDPRNESQAAIRMADFIADMADHARETNEDFFLIPQNGAYIVDAIKDAKGDHSALLERFYGAIGGIAIEDLYFYGNKDENNKFNPDEDQIKILQRDFVAKGIPVYVVDYITGDNRIDKFERMAIRDGFTPYAAPDRDLDRMAGPLDSGAAADFLM